MKTNTKKRTTLNTQLMVCIYAEHFKFIQIGTGYVSKLSTANFILLQLLFEPGQENVVPYSRNCQGNSPCSICLENWDECMESRFSARIRGKNKKTNKLFFRFRLALFGFSVLSVF